MLQRIIAGTEGQSQARVAFFYANPDLQNNFRAMKRLGRVTQ